MSVRLSRRSALFAGAGVAALPQVAWARGTGGQAAANDDAGLAEAVDAYVRRCLEAWPDNPALSVAVVKDGRAILTRGYGVKAMDRPERADERTLFAVASNTKAVTCAALAILVDEGKVKWDAPVRDYLPEFSLSKPELNDLVTVRDLVSHRIGFGLGAGDLLFWPNSDRTRAEIMAAVAHVPIEDQFRARYHYCNLMFIVAGEVVAAASGMSWEAFVQTRILDRLGMADTLPVMVNADPARCALPHGRVGPPLRYQGPMTRIGASVQEVWNWTSAGAAGGFMTHAVDWSKWMAVQLSGGLLPDGSRLFSEAQGREMWRPNIIVGSSAGPTPDLPGRAIASTYAMGWQVMDYRGERLITHGGGSPGGISGTVLLPGRGVGFSYFSNAEESLLLRSLRSGIADVVMGPTRTGPAFDWIADSKRLEAEGTARSLQAAAEIDAKQAAGAPPALPQSAYAGTWRDPWYGDVRITKRDVQLWLEFSRSPALNGPLVPYDGETFRTRFPDTREEDVFVTFALEDGRPVRATMKAVSPDADFSYDYHNLRLTKV